MYVRTHHVGMIEFTQETDLPNDVTRDAALRRRVGEGDAFDGDRLVGVLLASLVDDPVGALSDHVRPVVVVGM